MYEEPRSIVKQIKQVTIFQQIIIFRGKADQLAQKDLLPRFQKSQLLVWEVKKTSSLGVKSNFLRVRLSLQKIVSIFILSK